MQSTLIDPVLSAMQAQQQANFSAYITQFYPYQVELRNWLDSKGIIGIAAFKYEALNGETYREWRKFSGDSRIAALTALKAKYVAWGLVALDVSAMMLQVWSTIIP
jgi:hypothetical protein